MVIHSIDWAIIAFYFIISLAIGLYAARRAGKNSTEFFLSGRNMPWWLLGVSMVATTFSTDTPNLVTDIIRQNGVYGNWVWWVFLLTGMLTVFIYARLWRRSKVMTDLEFYEIRYSGKIAAFLRGFRAIYLGGLFNIIVIAMVTLALLKIGAVLLQWSPAKTLIIAATVTVVYSTLGGLRGILLTDFFQFILAMIGAVGAAVFLINLPQVGGLSNLINHEIVSTKLNLLPDFSNTNDLWLLLILPFAVQWWSVWYPGSEPGGGGYIAQRMLSAKDEKGAMAATLFFNIAHYALRPWPWILVALASLVVFPDLQSMQTVFTHVDPNLIRNDFAYPAMLTLLPKGFLGLVVASLLAAYMSTASTQLNWGASYIVHDFYHRFVNKDASEKQLVYAGRITTVLLMVFSCIFALALQNALQVFQILLQVGAGTGLIYILRWFWWRINAYTEITGMIISFVMALVFEFVFPGLGASIKLILGVTITTFTWILVTLLTRPTHIDTLKSFYCLVHPGGPGWKTVIENDDELRRLPQSDLGLGIQCMLVGCFTVYSALFAMGYWIYGRILSASIITIVFMISLTILIRLWNKMNFNDEVNE